MKLSSINEENLRLIFRNRIVLPLSRKSRIKKLNKTHFTIISNNCWGGTIYESYGLPKQSPTIGMFIMPEDYLKFISNLQYYLEQPLQFVEPQKSKWKSALEHKSNWGTYLIGKLDDIELHMLHHHDEDEARRKWSNRIKRINWKCIVYKFNDQNGATIEHIQRFMDMKLENKICFVSKKEFKDVKNTVFIKQPIKYKDGVKASREPFGHSKYIDITSFINNMG